MSVPSRSPLRHRLRSAAAGVAIVGAATFTTAACGEDVVDDGVEQEVEQGVDDVQEGVEDAEQNVQEGVEDAEQEIQEGAGEAEQEVDEETGEGG